MHFTQIAKKLEIEKPKLRQKKFKDIRFKNVSNNDTVLKITLPLKLALPASKGKENVKTSSPLFTERL